MKIRLLFIVFTILCLGAKAQDIPYINMLGMSTAEFKDAKFVYSKDKNRQVLTKRNGANVAVGVLSMLSGTPVNIIPDENDYSVIVQFGDKGASYLSVQFYKIDTYEQLVDFARSYGYDFSQTKTEDFIKMRFKYSDYTFELHRTIHRSAKAHTAPHGHTHIVDNTYESYAYYVYTGLPASSPYITKQLKVKEREEARRGKKQSVSDLM